MVVVLGVHLRTAKVGHELSLVLGPLRDLDLEVVSDATSGRVVNAIEKSAHNTEGLGDDSSDLTGVEAGLAELNGQLDDVDASEGRGAPKLVVVEGAGVHAEAEVGGTDEVLRDVEKLEKVGAA